MWLVFTAKQASAIELFPVHIFHLSRRHQVQEFLLVLAPFTAILFVLIEHILRWCESRNMFVADGANFPRKIFEIIAFGEPCELRNVV